VDIYEIGMAAKSNFLACENNLGQDEFTKMKTQQICRFSTCLGGAQRLSLSGAG
jgi:hypothetical protein